MSEIEEEKYVNGCRLSSSLLELEPFKVVVAEAKSVTDKGKVPSKNYNISSRGERTDYSPAGRYNNNIMRQINTENTSNERPSLPTGNMAGANTTSVSCDNIFDISELQVKRSNGKSTSPGQRSHSDAFDYVDEKRNHSLPKSIQRTPSKERLLVNEYPENRLPSELKKTKPKKPNRESLRRSRQDIGSSHLNLQNNNRSSIPQSLALESTGKAQNVHDYEELPVDQLDIPTDVKILQQRKLPQISPESQTGKFVPDQEMSSTGFTPISFQKKEATTPSEKTKNPRQRLNPMYAGLHMNLYDHGPGCEESNQKKPPIKCFRCLVAGVIVAIIFSFLSIVAISLFILGFLDPLTAGISSRGNFQTNVTQELLNARTQLKQQNELISKLKEEVSELNISSINSDTRIDDRFEEAKFQLVEAVKSLNISALKGPSTADVANCVHKTFGIGTSPTRNEIDSGKYFAEEGYVTTGVTCSASTGYVAYLKTREEEVEIGDKDSDVLPPPRTVYSCACHKSPNLALPATGERVECSIHYWQCPIL
ncbi:uncharacterized protein LOC120326671 [Styela clava]